MAEFVDIGRIASTQPIEACWRLSSIEEEIK